MFNSLDATVVRNIKAAYENAISYNSRFDDYYHRVYDYLYAVCAKRATETIAIGMNQWFLSGETDISTHNFIASATDVDATGIIGITLTKDGAHPDRNHIPDISDFATEVKKVSAFIKSGSNQEVKAFARDDGKCVFIVRLSDDNRRVPDTIMKLFFSTLPVMFKDTLFKNEPLSEAEKELSRKIVDPSITDNEFSRMAAVLLDVSGIREKSIRNSLGDLTRNLKERQIDSLKEQADNKRRRMEELDCELVTLVREFNQLSAMLTGLYASEGGDDTELIEYVIANKSVDIVSVNSEFDESYITILCHGALENFNEDMAERVINNPNSYVYHDNHGSKRFTDLGMEKAKLLSEHLFVKRDLKINIAAIYELWLGSCVKAPSGRSLPRPERDFYINNPHIYHYSCLGDYKPLMNQSMREMDIISAIALCGQSAVSVNFGESVTMFHFYDDLYATNAKCIEDKDGNKYTPTEMMDILYEQEKSVKE